MNNKIFFAANIPHKNYGIVIAMLYIVVICMLYIYVLPPLQSTHTEKADEQS